jgi:hypothetical protein
MRIIRNILGDNYSSFWDDVKKEQKKEKKDKISNNNLKNSDEENRDT